jgi:hypothetical protein
MSASTRMAPVARQRRKPAAVSMMTLSAPVSPISSQARQRKALPQASLSQPSTLRMRMKAAAPALAAACDGGSATISWSAPTPVSGSQIRAVSEAVGR